MDDQRDVSTRLLKSKAVVSLRAEQEIALALRSLPGWSVSHGSYYRDPISGKLRELDVVARRHFLRATGDDERSVSLDLFIEVKSLKDYHLVFAPSDMATDEVRPLSDWLIDDKETLAKILLERQLEVQTIKEILNGFRESCYGDDGTAVMHDRIIGPPPAQVVSTAFRETNVGGEREFDKSVLWDSIQGLSAVLEASMRRKMANFASDLPVTIENAQVDGRDISPIVIDELYRRVRHLRLFLPVVVLDSRLWVSDNGGLTEIEHARFVLHTDDYSQRRWFDVVSRSGFASWLARIVEHYDQHFGGPHEARIRDMSDGMMKIWEHLRDPEVNVAVTVTSVHDSNEEIARIAFTRKAAEESEV